jgi:hypothetical protein
MSSAIEASLRLEIAQYQAALAKAKGETQKFREKIKSTGGGLGNDLFGKMVGANLVSAGLQKGAASFQTLISRGLDFNLTMDSAAVGVANVLRKFDGLNAAAAKNEAAKALQKIIELEPRTAGGLADLSAGFMQTLATAKGVGITTEQNVVLTSKFANALANAGLQINQLGQEYRSILSGNITADSAIAKILGITNEEVNKVKAAGGDMFNFLNDKLGEFGEAGDSAGVALSSLQSSIDKTGGAILAGLFGQSIEGAKELAAWLDKNKALFEQLGAAAASAGVTAGEALKGASSVAADIWGAVENAGRGIGQLVWELDNYVKAVEEGKTAEQYAAEYNAILNLNQELADRVELERQYQAARAAAAVPQPASPLDRSGSGGGDGGGAGPEAAGGAAGKAEDELARKRAKLIEAKKQADRDEMTRAEKIKSLKEELGQKRNLMEGAAGIEGAAGESLQLDTELERVALQKELNRLLKEESESKRETARLIEENGRAAAAQYAEENAAREQAKKTLAEELAIAGARARGDSEGVERMERELKIREKAKEIQEATGASAAQARASAEQLIRLQEQGAARESGGTSEPGARRGHIGGVKKKRYMQSGLDEFHGNQTRDGTAATAFGANSLSGRRGPLSTATGPLSGRHAENARKQDNAGAAGGKLENLNAKMLAVLERGFFG